MPASSDILPLLCCGPSPALQRTLTFADWASDADTVRCSRVELSVGGKATNAARAITCANGKASVLSFAGGAHGSSMKTLLEQEGLPGIWVETATETRLCQTLVDPAGHRIRELVENAMAVSSEEWERFFQAVRKALPHHSGLLLCGSLPEDAPKNTYARLMEEARNAQRPVAIDAAGPALLAALATGPDLVKINRTEACAVTGTSSITDALDALLASGASRVLLTDGPHPAWAGEVEKHYTCPLPEITPLNPIGGGDTVTGVCFLQWMRGANLPQAAVAGLAAGMAQTLTRSPARFDPAQAEAFARNLVMEPA
jgi:1-phosphofructokinase family hexose kinase